MFLLDPGVAAALRRWRELKGTVTPDDLVLTDVNGKLPNMGSCEQTCRRLA